MAIESVTLLWQEWQVKLAVLLSLLLQCLLLLLATFRKSTANTFLSYLIYGIYLLSTCVAFATFYLIVGARFFAMSKMPCGLWASVMVLHLAGQDRLTAYSVKDNQNWRGSTLKIILQLFVHLGLFIPPGDLPFPTRIMLCLAVWRIACRAIRQILGTEEMRDSWVFPFDNPAIMDLSQILVQTDTDDSHQVVHQAHFLLKSSSLCLLAKVGCTPTFTHQVRLFFINIRPQYAIRIAEIELNFMYDSFYTDGTIRKHLNHNWSLVYAILRFIEPIVCVAALTFYIISSSAHLHSADISQADYDVTNVLLWGTVILEFLSYIMTVFSHWTIAALTGIHHDSISNVLFQFVPQRWRWWLFRRWSETISKFNFLRYSIRTSSLGPISKFCMWLLDVVLGTQNLVTSFMFVSQEWYTDNLGDRVISELQAKNPDSIITSLATQWPTHDSYLIDVLVWHIATELIFIYSNKFYNYRHRRDTKLLSDYMAYLLFMKSQSLNIPLMKTEAVQMYIQNIARERNDISFEDRLRRCCQDILRLNIPDNVAEADDYVRSLSLAISKANQFHNKYFGNMEALWQKLSQDWVDILLFAASKYDRIELIQGLCQGGELISIVWLLAFHLNIITVNNINIQNDSNFPLCQL